MTGKRFKLNGKIYPGTTTKLITYKYVIINISYSSITGTESRTDVNNERTLEQVSLSLSLRTG